MNASSSDFDVGGLLAVRLVGATPQDVRAVEARLGSPRRISGRTPDITVRFDAPTGPTGAVRRIGREALYGDDSFVVTSSNGRRLRIAFDELGGPIDLRADRAAAFLPLLVPLLNLSMLNKGVIPIHGVGFGLGERGIVGTGWSGAGKTALLLAALREGGVLLAAESVYLSPAGDAMIGLPEPVRIRARHLDEDRSLAGRMRAGDRARVTAVALAARVAGAAARRNSVAAQLAAALERQAFVDVAPRLLRSDATPAVRTPAMRPSVVLLLVSAGDRTRRVRLEPIAPSEAADRIATLMQAESLELVRHYLRFRFAFPDRRSELLESATERLRLGLREALRRTETYLLSQPWPPRVADLRHVVADLGGAGR